MQFTFLDDKQRAFLQLDSAQPTAAFSDFCFACAGDYKEPLLAAAMFVARLVVAGATRTQSHHCGLHFSSVSEQVEFAALCGSFDVFHGAKEYDLASGGVNPGRDKPGGSLVE